MTASYYNNVAHTLDAQGKHAQARPLLEKSLAIRMRLFGDDHFETISSYNNLAYNLDAQGQYAQAAARWLSAVKVQDAARLRLAFTGMERAAAEKSVRPALAAVRRSLGEPAAAWQALEEDMGRGLLDDLAAREDQKFTPQDRARRRELIAQLDRLDRLMESTPKNLDQARVRIDLRK